MSKSSYTPEAFAAEETFDYRVRFPKETANLSDARLYDMVAATEDDMEDDEWREYFTSGKLPEQSETDETDVDDDEITGIKDAFKEHVKRDINLSDNVLKNVIAQAGKTWRNFIDHEDMEGAIKFLKMAEENAAKVSVVDPGITTLVGKMDDDFHSALRDDIEAVAKTKVSAVHMLAHFRRIYTKEELDGMPVPGTEAEHVSGNQKPDKVKKKDQTGQPITTVWTNDFVSAMPEGREFEGWLDDISKESKSVGSVPRLKAKGKKELAAIKADMTNRRNALRSIVKRSIALHHQLTALSEMDKVGFAWVPGSKNDKGISMPTNYGEGEFNDNCEVVRQSPKPIWLFPKESPSDGRDFSVTQFLAFDIPLAVQNGGTMSDLTATAGRGSDEGQAGDGDGTDMPDDAAQATLSQFVNWFNKRDNQTKVRKLIADRAKNKDGEDWLELMGDLYLLTKPIYEQNRGAFEQLIQKERPEPQKKTA